MVSKFPRVRRDCDLIQDESRSCWASAMPFCWQGLLGNCKGVDTAGRFNTCLGSQGLVYTQQGSLYVQTIFHDYAYSNAGIEIF